MFGEIGAWMYKALGGIKPTQENPGFKEVVLQPNFVTGLNHFSATHKGPYGNISSDWKRTANGILYTVTIPPNSRATVHLPILKKKQFFKDRQKLSTLKANYITALQAGRYQFEWK